MKKNQLLKNVLFNIFGLLILTTFGCKRDVGGLQSPTFPTTAEVFIDGFTGDLSYAAYGTSDVRAFQVDNQVGYGNTTISMRYDVPDANSPNGSYAGGTYLSEIGRDLRGYNALTFYIKASQAATIAEVGFGDDLDLGTKQHQVALKNLQVNSSWKKVIIPLPDPSKLSREKGLFYYAAAPENGRGYSFWIDEVKFEKLTDLSGLTGVILNGDNRTISNAENGDKISLSPFEVSVNLPTGVNQRASISPYYLTFSSSVPSVATVNELGIVSVLSAGTTVITATMNGNITLGKLNLTSIGLAGFPPTPAPTPTRNAANVISMYSNAYTNVAIDTWNTRWLFSTAEESFVKINTDDVIRYKTLNFVGIEFTSNTINASTMTNFHLNIWTPDNTTLPNNFKIKLIDFGANNTFGGGDDKEHEITITRPTLVSNNWVTIDVPLSSFTGLTTRSNLAQMVFSGTIPNVFVDNVYFYK